MGSVPLEKKASEELLGQKKLSCKEVSADPVGSCEGGVKEPEFHTPLYVNSPRKGLQLPGRPSPSVLKRNLTSAPKCPLIDSGILIDS